MKFSGSVRALGRKRAVARSEVRKIVAPSRSFVE